MTDRIHDRRLGTITPNQLAFIESLLLRQGADVTQLRGIEVNGRAYERLSDLTKADASALIDFLLEAS